MCPGQSLQDGCADRKALKNAPGENLVMGKFLRSSAAWCTLQGLPSSCSVMDNSTHICTWNIFCGFVIYSNGKLDQTIKVEDNSSGMKVSLGTISNMLKKVYFSPWTCALLSVHSFLCPHPSLCSFYLPSSNQWKHSQTTDETICACVCMCNYVCLIMCAAPLEDTVERLKVA